MRRWFLIVLVVLLPLQSVWAGAAAYCQHEAQASGASHFGHHEHRHARDVPGIADDDGRSAEAGAVDVDCNVCHAASTVPFPAWHSAPAVQWQALAQPRRFLVLATRALAPPDKPNWAAAA